MAIGFFILSVPLWLNVGHLPIRLWDESRNAVNAIEMLQNGDYIIRSYENKPETWNLKPPLLTWLQVIAMHVVGLNEIAIRLPSILASMSSLFILFLWTFRLTKSYAFAFLGAGILATSAGFYGEHVGRFGDHDALLVFFSTALTYSCYLYYLTHKSCYLYWAALAVCLGILTKSIAILIMLPGIAMFFATQKRAIETLANNHLYFAITLGLVPVISYYGVREYLQPGFLRFVWNDELFPRYFNSSENFDYSSENFWYYFKLLWNKHMSIWPLLLPLVLSVPFLKRKNEGWPYLLITSVSYLLILSKGTKNYWYDASVIPLLSALIAVSVHVVYSRLFKTKTYALVLALGLLCLPFAQAHNYALNPSEKYYEWETNGISHFLTDENHLQNLTANTQLLLDTTYGYEPHLFYVKKLRIERLLPLERTIIQHVKTSDTLLIGHESTLNALKIGYEITVLDSSYSHTKLVAVGKSLL